jgi:predicted nucleotidyltransferase
MDPQTPIRLALDVPRAAIAEFCQRWQIVELALFGSVLRDDFRPESDVDCLVTFASGAGWGLLDLVGMEFDLEELLGRRADLVERVVVEQSPNRLRRDEILGSARVVYAAR